MTRTIAALAVLVMMLIGGFGDVAASAAWSSTTLTTKAIGTDEIDWP